MAQSRSSADVHQDELCPPNKRYALMDANKKVDLENLLCLDERKSKGIVGMKIPDWMITDEMKLTENYQLYAEVFGVDVPTTQSQPIESTQGTHRTTSAPMSPNPVVAEGESSAPRRSTVIRLRIPPPRSTRLSLPTPVLTTDESDDLILQDTLQVSLAEQKSHEELEATQNVEKVKEHLIAEEIEKLVEGSENVEETIEVTSSPLWNDDNQVDPGTMLEPRNDKESPEVEKIVDISQPVNVIEEEEESAEEDYKLRRREKEKYVEEIRNTPSPTTIRSPRIPTNLLQGRYGYLFEHLSAKFMPRRKFNELAKNLEDIMMESLPKLVDERIKRILQTQVLLHVAQGIILEREKSQADVTKMIVEVIQQERVNLHLEISSQVNDAIVNHIPSHVDSSVATTPCIPPAVRLRDQDDPHDDAHPEGRIVQRGRRYLSMEHLRLEDHLMVKIMKVNQVHQSQVDSSIRRYMSGRENSAKRQKIYEHGTFEIGGSSYGQDYEDDDVLPNEKVSQELVDEISQNVDEAKLHNVESRKEIIVLPCQPKPTPVVQSCQRDPKAPGLLMVNQDLLTSIWVNKCVKRFNPYARYGVEHWKNPHAKIFYIRKQQEPKKPKEEVYSNSKIVQTIKTYWELGHEYKFITEIVARRENGSIVSITESDYKNLNKNDTKDMYLLIINHKVDDYADWIVVYQQQVNLTAPTITFPCIEKYKMFSIVSEPVYDIIYENNKKEKRVMRRQEVHKFCDATLKRVLEGLKSYNNDAKYGYVTHNLSKEDVEYL
ncbi:hypothetical protein Tco_0964481 [Tanacetum coccineum]